jgi:hypothetical protein
MPPTIPHELVAEALRSTLEAISTANGYAYTPDLVRRCSFWPDPAALDISRETLYFVRSTGRAGSWYDGRRAVVLHEFAILCCHRFEEPSENPLEAEPVREQISAAMEADVVRALWADPRLGLPAYVIDAMHGGWRADHDYSLARWSVVEVSIVVRYQHDQVIP